MLANEWDMEDLKDWGVDIPVDWGNDAVGKEMEKEAEEDDFDEEKDAVEPICQRGDIWMLGQHTLMCGDSTSEEDVQRLTGGEKIDLWLTDPPYNVAIQNTKGMTIMNDSMGKNAFGEFLKSAFRQANNVMAKGAPYYVWFASCEHLNFEGALNAVGLKVKQELIWNKNQLVLGRSHYQWKHEPCLYRWKGDSCKYFCGERNHTSVIEDKKEIDIKKMKASEMRELLFKIYDDKVPTTVINENKPQRDDEHPTMKPIKLFGRLIMNSSRQKDKVLDTFGGSGTTLIACEQLDRTCYMMELDPHYCDVIIARWEKLTGNKAIKKQ
jgi:site-specific DNA-methyltransferase (adenine-specific)